MKHHFIPLLFALAATFSAAAVEPLTLSFSRTGTDVASVGMTATGISGVSATLTDLSPLPIANWSASDAVFSQVNATTSPTIIYNITVSGLPANYSFNTIDITTSAFNAQGAAQQNSDGKNRQYNVNFAANGTAFGSLSNIDIAAGSTGSMAKKEWRLSAATVTPGSDLQLTITVTKGSENVGCFFGLSQIQLSTAQTTEPEQPEEPTPQANVYTIGWKSADTRLIYQDASGNLLTSTNTTNQMMKFWELVPTDNENCYYIRNCTSGLYIGSCNKTPASASKITMSATPVEYYIATTAATDNAIKECVWFSSTDCANYNDESKNPRALNKDGASESVITWTAGQSGNSWNVGSYWRLSLTDYLYEVKPFSSSTTIGSPNGLFYINNSNGQYYTTDGQWTETPGDNAKWYFVGTSNYAEGYQIVAAAGNQPLNSGIGYGIYATDGGYEFRDNAGTPLDLAGCTTIKFSRVRTEFALHNQIYNIPCGSLGSNWIAQVNIGSDYHYPMAEKKGSAVNYPTAAKPANKYVILSRDAATVNIGGETTMYITLNAAPTADDRLTLYLDLDRDGVFETTIPVEIGRECSAKIQVPDSVAPGITRARLRLTSNGLPGPEDDVVGQVLDLRLNLVLPTDEMLAPEVKSSDETRGLASYYESEGRATATQLSSSAFLYWTDNGRVVSVAATMNAGFSPEKHLLTAYFTPNTDYLKDEETALLAIEAPKGSISYANGMVSVTQAEPTAILVYDLEGKLAAAVRRVSSLSVAALPSGIYIVKALTATGTISAKIIK